MLFCLFGSIGDIYLTLNKHSKKRKQILHDEAKSSPKSPSYTERGHPLGREVNR
jgi:hypothetical protein